MLSALLGAHHSGFAVPKYNHSKDSSHRAPQSKVVRLMWIGTRATDSLEEKEQTCDLSAKSGICCRQCLTVVFKAYFAPVMDFNQCFGIPTALQPCILDLIS